MKVAGTNSGEVRPINLYVINGLLLLEWKLKGAKEERINFETGSEPPLFTLLISGSNDGRRRIHKKSV